MGALRRWHRLIGLVVGLPCLLWGLSGAILAWKNWASEPPVRTQAAPLRPFRVPVEQALKALGRAEAPLQVEWRHVAAAPRYVIRFATPPLVQLVDGEDGRVVSRLDAQGAQAVGQGEAPPGVAVRDCALQTTGSLIYPSWGELPAFRVGLANGDDVYVSPTTGQVLAHVDTQFRIIRVAFYGLHVWKFSQAQEAPASYLVLLAMGLVLAAAGATGLWLGLRGLGPRRRRLSTAP